MEPFLIVVCVIFFLNGLFLVASLIYTVKASKHKGDPRLSTLGSVLNPRMSLQPQVVIYEAIVRLSGNPGLNKQHGTEKTDNHTTQAA